MSDTEAGSQPTASAGVDRRGEDRVTATEANFPAGVKGESDCNEGMDGAENAQCDPDSGLDPAACALGSAAEFDLDQLNDNLQDYGEDNLSLEVNFGDGSSCRASDGNHHDTEEKEKERDAGDGGQEGDGERESSPGGDTGGDGARQEDATRDGKSHDHVVMREKRSGSGSGQESRQGKKRNSLEIRNNIPDVDEVKRYDDDIITDLTKLQSQGAMPKIKKKSPGLARRLPEPRNAPADRDTSSSEKDMDQAESELDTSVRSAQKDFESQLRIGTMPPYTSTGIVPSSESTRAAETPDEESLDKKKKSSSFENLCDSLLGNDGKSSQDAEGQLSREQDSELDNAESRAEPNKNMDIENEYDYVKYARIQQGDSYVGMRLAYSSAGENRLENGARPPGDEPFLGSSQEGSPEKRIQKPILMTSDQLKMAKVNEASLTEIPLNSSSDQLHCDERKNFSLSPEPTECDSAEVESVLSEEGKSSASGMPMVEDGLSSSQASDTEDAVSTAGDSQQAGGRPAEILKRRYKHDLEQELRNLASRAGYQRSEDSHSAMSVTTDNSSSVQSTPSHEGHPGHHQHHHTHHQRHHIQKDGEEEEEEDMVIQDIRSVVRKSRSMTLEATYPDGDSDQEPVWVMRDSYVRKLQRQEEMRRVREEIERQQDEDYVTGEQEQVYQVDEEDQSLMKYQYNRNEGKAFHTSKDYDTDEETDELMDKQYTRDEKVDIPELSRPPVNRSAQAEKRRARAREVTLRDPDNETVLIEGVLFRARYLGSTTLISEGQPSKPLRMMQAQEAVGRIKAPEGENQPSTEVDLFVSIEKIMVLNTDLQEIMMDHALRTISYIADIGDVLVVMARRGPVTSPMADGSRRHKRQTKICCHVFDTDEAQLIAQSIGQAFQVAYMEFLKANGIDDPGLMKEIDYQEVLNQQEIFGEELFLFSNKEMQKEVIVPKLKGEPLGVVIVESGWGSMVPTVVLANMGPAGAAARCGQLNIGDQIMSINGVSLVGLPLSSCQNYIKAAKNQTVVKLSVVSCPPVVEVLIKRPDVKYQLGFSVQNGVICSLLRGGIAERGGVRVGHRIIEINGSSVVAVPHEKIVSMLATSVGEITMKTMPTAIYRLLTGQDTPHFI